MHKPFILNMRLNELYKSEQDRYMAKKLETVKASVNSRCPESLYFTTLIFTDQLHYLAFVIHNQY